METSSVTVEYTDPSGTYPSVAQELNRRLPLRNLHWNSSARPLRSIASLHVELIPATKSPLESSALSNGDSTSDRKDDTAPKGESTKKERRHQFPGLQRTPYLKTYLLQCSDVETYRASSRKEIREWLSNQTTPSQSSSSANKQENHDAFEWLIVLVTPTSAEGSDTFKRSTSASIEKRTSSSRWTSRSSVTVIEKIRSDFNGTSKNAVDRVTEIQVAEHTTGDHEGANELSQESNSGWDDMVAKMKSLILASFDLRVSQYEEDIKEKQVQRNLPGWNFNTFFVLKEGLARGFESVGLLEDALTDYHELAAGLNAIIDEQNDDDSLDQQTTQFNEYTDDLYEDFKQASMITSKSNTLSERRLNLGVSILDTERKPFRDLILENKISAFDFQCYVFARQVTLLLRLANAIPKKFSVSNGVLSDSMSMPSSRSSNARTSLSKPIDDEPEGLFMLAEVCQRASEFITSAARTIRVDIKTARRKPSNDTVGAAGRLEALYNDTIENLVASWTFSASQCILEATSAQSLSVQIDTLLRQFRPTTTTGDTEHEQKVADLVKIVHHKHLPNRTSSLQPQDLPLPKSPPRDSFPSVASLDAARLLSPGTPHPGAQELAAQRGNLLSLQRRVLSSLGLNRRGWTEGLADLTPLLNLENQEMQDEDLEQGSERDAVNPENLSASAQTSFMAGMGDRTLLLALQSSNEFYKQYERLTASTIAHYVVGNRNKAAEGMIADLAVVRFRLKDYAVAASYFGQLSQFYATNDWSDVELALLDMHAQCLKQLGKTEEYIQVALKLLAKMIRSTFTRVSEQGGFSSAHDSGKKTSDNVSRYLEELVFASKSLDQPFSVPSDKFFHAICVRPYVHHYPDRDGFQLLLQLWSLMPDEFQAQSVQLNIISDGEEQPYEMWLAAEAPLDIKPGMNEIHVESRLMRPAWYILDKVIVKAQNIMFVYDSSPQSDNHLLRHTTLLDKFGDLRRPRFLVWARQESLTAQLRHYERIHIEKPNSVIVEISTGANAILRGELSLRAASAGLRLRTADAEISAGETPVLRNSQTGIVSFGELSPSGTTSIKIPYSTENELREIVVRIEVNYTTDKGEFIYVCIPRISVMLPLAVNVQDVFKQDALFCKFAIGTSTSMPLRISNCYVEANDMFDASSPSLAGQEVDVFVRQPLSLVSRITPRINSSEFKPDANERRLSLHIEYRCLDQEICAIIEKELWTALTTMSLKAFSSLLVTTLLATLRLRFSNLDVETIGLLREVDLGSFEDLGWQNVLSAIPPERRKEIEQWLRGWHKEHNTVFLEGDSKSLPIQYLTVPVDLPQVQVVHTARLSPLNGMRSPHSDIASVAIGQALPMELVISHTRQWGGERRPETETQALDFYFEVQANPDVWLIGGQRKAQFSAQKGESQSFAILFVPQKTGYLMYPSIEIQPVTAQRNGDLGETGDLAIESPISCETDYRNQGETILVVPDLSSTTVSLDPSGSAGGAWLVESRNR